MLQILFHFKQKVYLLFFFKWASSVITSLLTDAVHIDDFVDADDIDVLHRKELELNFNRLSENNIQLRKEKADLGKELEKRTAEKAAVEKDLAKFKTEANSTEFVLKGKLVSRETFFKKYCYLQIEQEISCCVSYSHRTDCKQGSCIKI